MRWIAVLAICLVGAASARADDWEPRRDPFDPVVVRRYKEILAHDPHAEGAFRQLLVLYQQYRTVAKLEAEYREVLATGDDWAALVVLARLPRPSRAESLALWKRVVAAKPDDALGWLAAGDAAAGEPAAARDAFQRAVKLLSAPRQKQLALTKLVRAARLANDGATVDGAFAELIALSPNDGQLWLDRGDAQLDAKRYADAKTSYDNAQALLRTDPPRQLTAMTKQGMALDALGKPDDAIAQYEHTLEKVPSGYYLGEELVTRIIDIERRRKRLGAAITRFETRWPAKRRGYFEWLTLGDLYSETGDQNRAIDAYKQAVARAPTEVVTQRKLIALLEKVRPAEALAQHEAAARVAPGDADLQIELAKRYHDTQPKQALATLAAVGRLLDQNVNVHITLAGLYEQWNEQALALGEYETIAKIEPKEPSHAVVLGEAYWRAGQEDKAKAAWKRLAKINTTQALLAYGDTLAAHEMWEEAKAAYSTSIALDVANVNAWYGRARVLDSTSKFSDAIEDARRAVALTGLATYDAGLRNRQVFARILGHAYAQGDHTTLEMAVARWRFAFDHGDSAAGYMLLAHHERLGDRMEHELLEQLHRRVPADDSLAIALSYSYVKRREFRRARDELDGILRRSPKRAEEIGKLIAQLEEQRARAELDIRWDAEGQPRRPHHPDLAGRDNRFGFRFALGSDIHAASGALIGLGVYHHARLARGTTFVTRFEWTQRDNQMAEINAIALAGGVTTRILDARKFEVALGVAPRFELRFPSTESSAWKRAGICGDATLEVQPRGLPAVIGLRFDQSLTDSPRSSSLILELGFEVR
jgi:predicted Zn-dependent protease